MSRLCIANKFKITTITLSRMYIFNHRDSWQKNIYIIDTYNINDKRVHKIFNATHSLFIFGILSARIYSADKMLAERYFCSYSVVPSSRKVC